jgi:hypothetical protein
MGNWKFSNAGFVATAVVLGSLAVACLTGGKVDYKEVAATAVGGYFGYLKGTGDNGGNDR